MTGFGNQRNEDGLRLQDRQGTSTLTRVTVEGNAADQARIVNSYGSSATLTISNSAFRNGTGLDSRDALRLQTIGTGSLTATVSGATLANVPAVGLHAIAGDSSRLSLKTNGGVWSGPGGTSQGVAIEASGAADVAVAVRNTSTLTGYGGDAIRVQAALCSAGIVQGEVSNARVGNGGTSGSADGQRHRGRADRCGHGAAAAQQQHRRRRRRRRHRPRRKPCTSEADSSPLT